MYYNMDKENIIVSLNFGNKYTQIKEHWLKRINDKCGKNFTINTLGVNEFNNLNFKLNNEYAFWDVVRLNSIINMIETHNKNVIHIDQDIIIEKNIKPLVDLPYDIIISTEIGGNKSFPPECSKILGFGVCSGFYILKPSSIHFMKNILDNMKSKKFGSYSDQVNLMNYIVNRDYVLSEQDIILDNKKYTNKIITIGDIKICVLDFNIITRDPILNNGQFGNHINIDNVGGVHNFIKYFYEDLENLPLTCRCGKRHLGDNNVCNHIEIRNNKNNS